MRDPAVSFLVNTNFDPSVAQLAELVSREKVDRVVSVVHYARPGAAELRQLDPLQATGGAFVVPACGHGSLRRGRANGLRGRA